MKVTQHIRSAAENWTAGNEHVVLPLTFFGGSHSTIEVKLNSLCTDDVISAKLTKLRLKVNIIHEDVNANDWLSACFYLVLAATSGTISKGSYNLTSYANIAEALELACDNEIPGIEVLAWTPFVREALVDSSNYILSTYQLAASYTPPKGTKGLFQSDIHLDEPEARTYICVVGTSYASGGVVRVEGIADLSYQLRNRGLKGLQL